jgi:YidC/Oxa1 family membrane protein insertase
MITSRILITALAVLISTPATALVDTTECAELLERIALPYAGQQKLKGSITHCGGNQAFIDYGLSDEQVRLSVGITELSVEDQYQFFGLAGFYNTVGLVEIGVSENHAISPSGAWIAVVGRFKAVLFNAPGATLELNSEAINFSWPANTPVLLNLVSGDKSELGSINSEFDAIRYSHLWGWLAALSKTIEWSVVGIHRYIINSWGWSVIVLALFIKIILFPVGQITARFQQQINRHRAILEPRISEIKMNYYGEEAHVRIMAAHKDLGISPFYSLKPMLGTLVQIPVFIAVFNALGEMHQLNNQAFLWVDNLAYPDSVVSLPFAVPLLGFNLSLLPIMMSAFNILAAFLVRDSVSSPDALRKDRFKLYLMAAAFFVLFYPFPAAMVLYWTATNMLHIVQQRLIEV